MKTKKPITASEMGQRSVVVRRKKYGKKFNQRMKDVRAGKKLDERTETIPNEGVGKKL